MKGIIVVLTLLFSARASAQTSDREIPLPPSSIESLNRGMARTEHHLDLAEITEHLVGGNFHTITGHFRITCPDGSSRSVDLVLTPRPVSDTATDRLKSMGYRPMSVDEAMAAMTGDGVLQLNAARLAVSVLKMSCLRSVEQATPSFYAALSLWSKEGEYMRVYQHVTASVFNQLK